MPRQTPETQVTNKLSVVSTPVSTFIAPRKPVTDKSKTQGMLQTAQAIAGFGDSATKINNVMMEQAERTAKEEYLKNEGDWSKYTEKHPFISHLNPHMENNFNKLRAEDEIKTLLSEFEQTHTDNYDLDDEEYLQALRETEAKAYQIANDNGVTMYHKEESINPLLNQFTQNNWTSFTNGKKAYRHKEVLNMTTKNVKDIWKNAKASGKLISADTNAQISQALADSGLNKTEQVATLLTAMQEDMTESIYDTDKPYDLSPAKYSSLLRNVTVEGKSLEELGFGGEIVKLEEQFAKTRISRIREAEALKKLKQESDMDDLADKLSENIYKQLNDPSLDRATRVRITNDLFEKAVGDAVGLKLGTNAVAMINNLKAQRDALMDAKLDCATDPAVFSTLLNNTEDYTKAEILEFKAKKQLSWKDTNTILKTKDSEVSKKVVKDLKVVDTQWKSISKAQVAKYGTISFNKKRAEEIVLRYTAERDRILDKSLAVASQDSKDYIKLDADLRARMEKELKETFSSSEQQEPRGKSSLFNLGSEPTKSTIKTDNAIKSKENNQSSIKYF